MGVISHVERSKMVVLSNKYQQMLFYRAIDKKITEHYYRDYRGNPAISVRREAANAEVQFNQVIRNEVMNSTNTALRSYADLLYVRCVPHETSYSLLYSHTIQQMQHGIADFNIVAPVNLEIDRVTYDQQIVELTKAIETFKKELS